MSRFFAGQRVKLVRSAWAGVTARVHSFERSEGGYDMVVRLDAAAKCGSHVIESGALADAYSWQWEPILPEGQCASDYSLNELLDRCKQGEGVPA